MKINLRMAIPFLIITAIIILVDLYTNKALTEIFADYKIEKFGYYYKLVSWIFTTTIILLFLIMFLNFDKIDLAKSYSMFFFLSSLLLAILLSKLSFNTFHFVEDIVFVISKYIFSFPHRFILISKIGLISGFLTLFLMIYGIFWGKYKYTIHNTTIESSDLPKSFDGFKIVQISDLHIGSFRNKPEKLNEAVDLINKQNPDIIVFTGDLVNNFASEVDEFIPILKKLKAKHGLYSILGNHDYGDYYQWKSENDKIQNLENLCSIQREIGFNLLKNQSTEIEINGEKIAFVGVENWGLPPFPIHGDLALALQNTDSTKTKILLSHDPSHWTEQVKNKTNILLTLSGHTHGMQMGFEFGRFRWSPVKFKYPLWAGLYEENNQYLYVNRGLGFIGFSGRVGIWPEIAVITLKAKK